MTINERAKQIAAATQDAYSVDRYTTAAWIGVARLLLKAGASTAEATVILGSKHTRWAADASGKRTCNVSANDFDRYAKQSTGTSYARMIEEARKELGTAPKVEPALSGAFLAGACEGEQIADLINLARAVSQMTPSGYRPLIESAKALIAEIEARAKAGR